MATQLFEEISDHLVTNSLATLISEERKAEIAKIGKSWDFYYGYQEQYIKKYRGESDDDYADKNKMVFNYTRAVTDEYVSGVFAKPVAVTISDPKYSERWDAISDPMSFFKVLPFYTKVQRIAEISQMCIVMIRYDPVAESTYFEEVRGEFVHFLPDPDKPKEIGTLIISYLFDTGDPMPSRRFMRRIEIWDKEEWAIYLYSPNMRQKKLMDSGPNPYGFIPAVRYVPEEDDNTFYGVSAIYDVVRINEEYNNLWTAMMRTSIMQSFSLLVVTTEGELKVEVAPIRFLKFEQTEDADAKYITPQPKIDEVRRVLEQLKKELSDVSRVPAEVLSSTPGQGGPYQSGFALRIKRLPIEEVWNKRRLSYGPAYRSNIRMALTVDAINKKEDPPPDDLGIDIEFSDTKPGLSPQEQTIQDEFDLRYGVITPVDLMMRKYPECLRRRP